MDLQWWQIVIGVVVGLFSLMILVILHELGHAIVAKRNGVAVEEFGLGFPPRAKILGKYKGTLVTLNWLIPLGGFCKMRGESDDDRRKGSFGAASFWAKTKILFAGVAVNFVTACVIFTALAFVGLPVILASQFAISSDNHGARGVVEVAETVKNSVAAKNGIKKGDEIHAIDGKKVAISSEVSALTKAKAGEKVTVDLARDGKTFAKIVRLGGKNSPTGQLGVVMAQKSAPIIRATWSAPLVGVADTAQFMWLTLQGLCGLVGNFFGGIFGMVLGANGASAQIGTAAQSVAGPIGILGEVFPAALFAGPTTFLFIMGVISLTLVVMNILPIPGLDGGRWYLIALFKLLRKPLTKAREETIVGYGMLVIFAIAILATVSDIWKLV